MKSEVRPYSPLNPETVQKVINCLENDLRFKLPRLDYPEETEIAELYYDEELKTTLMESGLTRGERTLVKSTLGNVARSGRPITIGEVRRMTDQELLRIEKIGKKKRGLLRALFGKIPEEADLPGQEVTLPYRNLNEKELAQAKALFMKDYEHLLKLPRIEVDEDKNVLYLNMFNRLNQILTSRGFTLGEKRGIGIILGRLFPFTVGEVKKMSDEELLEIEGIGHRGLLTIRILFGYAQSEPDIPDFLRQRK